MKEQAVIWNELKKQTIGHDEGLHTNGRGSRVLT